MTPRRRDYDENFENEEDGYEGRDDFGSDQPVELEGTSAGEVLGLLNNAITMVASAKQVPLTATAWITKDEMLEILEEARQALPEELRSARWLLKERDDHLRRAQQEAQEIIAEAKVQAERMVERTEVVRQAKRHAQEIVEEAYSQARKLKNEAEDYCDRKLAAFEIALNDVLKVVQAGRNKLSVRPLSIPSNESDIGETGAGSEAEAAFFDQDDELDEE